MCFLAKEIGLVSGNGVDQVNDFFCIVTAAAKRYSQYSLIGIASSRPLSCAA